VRLTDLLTITIEFVVDTGFTGMLTLRLEYVRPLNLEYLDMWSVDLADG